MKVKELKVFKLAEEYFSVFDTLNMKIFQFYNESPENTPLSYRNYEPLDFWVQHLNILMNSDLFLREIYAFKDSLVLNLDNSIVFYDLEDSYVHDSTHLLRNFLSKLINTWIGILPMLVELFLNPRYDEFGAVEFKLIYFWFDVIYPISEILKILYSWHQPSILFPEAVGLYEKDYGYFSIIDIDPVFLTDEKFVKYKGCSKEFWMDWLVNNVTEDSGILAILNLAMRRKPEYKNRKQDLNPKEFISFILGEFLSDIDVDTIAFLAINGPANLEVFRELGVRKYTRNLRIILKFMKVKELKFYKSIEVYKEFFTILHLKIRIFSRESPENTPLEYRNYDIEDFWSQHYSILINLNLLIVEETVRYKGDLIFNVDKSIVFYEDLCITNSSRLLQTFLYRLNLVWISILPMFSELYSNSRYDLGALE